MNILNVSFGFFAFMPEGWIFMITIILVECVALSYLLTDSWKNKKIYMTVTVSNIVSGIIGILGSLKLNGGWWLVVWFPWVSKNEVSGKEAIDRLVEFYAFAFILTLIIEGIVNYILLKKTYTAKKIIVNTILVNVLSYALGSLALYNYSFH